MEGIFLQVLNMSITASFIALAVIIIRLFLKKVPRWITLLLWLFVAIRLVMPFSFESALSLIPKSEVIAPNTVYSEIQGADPHLFYEDDGELPVISDDPEADTGNSQKSPSLSIPFVASLLWVAGIGGMLLYTLISYLKLKRQVAASIEVEKGLFICDNVDTPFILGVIKPRIYLPSNLTESESDYVIAHERAHLKRGDHLIKPLSFLLLSVYWFNPILWVSYILLSKDIEIACDQKVIKDMDMENKKNYSTTLLNLSIQRRLVSACPLAFGEVGVKQRIRNILSYKKPAFWIMVVSVILCIAVAVCFLTNPLSGIKTKVLDGGSELQGLSVDVLKIWGDDKGQPVIKVKFRNENDFELTCGDEFYIYKEVDGEWVNCREGEYAFTLIGYKLKAKGSLTHEYGLRYVDMTASGKYRFESTATRSTGITQPESYKVWADFEIKKGVEGSGMVVHNFAMGSYVCHNSNEPIVTKPYIYLDPDGSFTSHFSGFSSTIYGGEYTAENNKLTLIEKHPDPLLPDKYIEGDRFVFNVIDEKTLQFVESESSSVGTYRYAQGEAPKAPFEDGALFEWEDENALNDSALTAEIDDIKVSDPKDRYLTVRWKNNSDTEQYFASEFYIFRLENGEWWLDSSVEEIFYEDIANIVEPHSIRQKKYDLGNFGIEKPGLYRFSSPQENIKLTFEITEEDLNPTQPVISSPTSFSQAVSVHNVNFDERHTKGYASNGEKLLGINGNSVYEFYSTLKDFTLERTHEPSSLTHCAHFSLRDIEGDDIGVYVYEDDYVKLSGYSLSYSAIYKSKGITKAAKDYFDRIYSQTKDLYTLTYEDHQYTCEIKANDGSVIYSYQGTRQPHIEIVDENLVAVWVQAGTGTLTRWTTFCNAETKEVSEDVFYGIVDYLNGLVCSTGHSEVTVCALWDDSRVQHINKFKSPISSFTENITGARFVNDGKQIEVTYLSGEYQNGEEVVPVTEYFDVEL